MLILGVETTTLNGSLCLIRDKKILTTREWSRTGSHSEFVTTSFQSCLKECAVDAKDIDVIAVDIGPGSFTGIRVGINFVRSLSYVLNKPIFLVNSLALIAQSIADDRTFQGQTVNVLQFAFRDLFYLAQYKIDNGRVFETLAPQAYTAPMLKNVFASCPATIGPGVETLRGLRAFDSDFNLKDFPSYSSGPHAKQFLNFNYQYNSPDHLTDWIHTIPLYIRASEAEEKLKKNF